MGEVEVPADAYYGVFTVRARDNFAITGDRFPAELIVALAEIKLAAARVNRDNGDLDEELASAIIDAAQEIIDGELHDQFILDPVQAGAGTATHMNANEVIANRATELLGGEKGEYLVDPHDHVNMGQSTNNVFPTAVRLACLERLDALQDAVEGLADSFEERADAIDQVKVGRTHLQDAVPVTVAQELEAYATMCRQGVERFARARDELLEVGIGGNAVGTGVNTEPGFAEDLTRELGDVTGRELRETPDHVFRTQSYAAVDAFSGSIRAFVADMRKLADDLMLLSSGPKAGIGELELPEVEPGSSIMPGKVNPSIVEMFKMACIRALGDDHAVSLASGEGDLEMNVMGPLVADRLLDALGTLTRATRTLDRKCVQGLECNDERAQAMFDASTATATALSPYIGYHRTAVAVREALERDATVREVVEEKEWMTAEELETVLDPARMTGPRGVDDDLRERVQERLDDVDD